MRVKSNQTAILTTFRDSTTPSAETAVTVATTANKTTESDIVAKDSRRTVEVGTSIPTYFPFAVMGVVNPSHAPGRRPRGADIGGGRKRVAITNRTNVAVPNARTYLTTTAIPAGTSNCQRQTPTRRMQLIGRKYCRQVSMTWSMRSRGSDQRIHIITKTSSQHLPKKTAMLRRLPSQKPHAELGSNGNSPVCQPPRNSRAASPLTANMLPYSARKKIDQRRPLYSVWNPATSSLSASARSNGARLQLAVAVMKKIKKIGR